MNTKLLFLFLLLLFSLHINAQSQYIVGNTTNEEGYRLQNVTILNLKTNQTVQSDEVGNFVIAAVNNDELRFVKNGYERVIIHLKEENFQHSLSVKLVKRAQEIEEVKIAYQPTGDLNKDLKYYGDTKSVKKLKAETAKYIRSESTPEVLAPKSGEFVQPVGKGFFVGGPKSQWDDVDFMQFLIQNLGNEFFTQDLQLKPSQIQPFIYYVFRNFERKEALFYGTCTQYDLSRFIKEANSKLEDYRNNLPNDPPKKKKKK